MFTRDFGIYCTDDLRIVLAFMFYQVIIGCRCSISKKLIALKVTMKQLILRRVTFILLSIFTCITFFFIQFYDKAHVQAVRHKEEHKKEIVCQEMTPKRIITLSGNRYYVLNNYFLAETHFRCNESITYTTHAEWTYLDNLIPITERWMGPVSVSVYCPGKDFIQALNVISYLRQCESPLVKKFVTFHMIFDVHYIPDVNISNASNLVPINCKNAKLNVLFTKNNETERQKRKLLYPINIARNVARKNALTHFIFPSDIELYPSPNLVPEFLRMIVRDSATLQNSSRNVFALAVFELQLSVTRLPSTKVELVELLENGTAVPFHKFTCASCHAIPNAEEWVTAEIKPGLNTFYVAKRREEYRNWEPFFIGTNDEPLFDERLSWEGKRDKLVQGFALCLLEYNFHILDNAFLVHRPGVKMEANWTETHEAQKQFIDETIVPELEKFYGNGTKEHGCAA